MQHINIIRKYVKCSIIICFLNKGCNSSNFKRTKAASYGIRGLLNNGGVFGSTAEPVFGGMAVNFAIL